MSNEHQQQRFQGAFNKSLFMDIYDRHSHVQLYQRWGNGNV